MKTEELEKRKERAATETFVIAKTTEGFRVCSPLNPASQYVVTGIPDAPRCTCPDFTHNEGDPEWLCKHILAVLNQMPVIPATPEAPPAGAATGQKPPGNGRPRRERKSGNHNNGTAQMLLKRSVSPDGRIDSLSVEFSCPAGSLTTGEIKQQAATILALQGEIAAGFLKTNGIGNGKESQPGNGNGSVKEPASDGAMPATMLNIGGMDTKWGRRLYLAVQVNDQTLKLFGTAQQLGEAVKAAGFAGMADHLAEGMALNLPCRAITKPSGNGKYVNVERVLPATRGNGG